MDTQVREKLLKAIQEARKMLQKENSVSGDGTAAGIGGAEAVGTDTPNTSPGTATAETNKDQQGLVRNKLKTKKVVEGKKKVKLIPSPSNSSSKKG